MLADAVNFGFVIEGQGEVEAVPLLIRRISYELGLSIAIRTSRPVRITKSKILRVDQAALAAVMDLTAARRCRAFDRLYREIARLCSEASCSRMK